jgi:(1->4)-alpha-D-glucan 1-alpha-D-glucosylmutase
VGEKIGEKMPDEWPIFGTTGYVFLNSLNGVFVSTKNAKACDDIYHQFIGNRVNFLDIVYEKKKLVMQVSMSGEVNALAHYLSNIAEQNRHTRDFTLNSLIRALTEIIACFPVYRTYVNSVDIKDRDRQYIEEAVSKAKRRNPTISRFIFDFLKDVLLLNIPEELGENVKYGWLDFTMKFQQITGPVMAKGLEDTAFYAFTRLVSLNEVGGHAERFGLSLEAFHGQNIEGLKAWPHSLITTSTHDTKRSEDVRARINVLSEIPREWKEGLIKWSRHNKKEKKIIDGQAVPDRNEEYLFYQTLIGAWPIDPMDEKGYEIFQDRIKEYMLKAIREAKINTSWINPYTDYEDAITGFIGAAMSDMHFISDFKIFQKMISGFGMYNSLSQTLLKIASPGVPDFYQGTELWNLSLVDPDNRRPVDYSEGMSLLDQLKKREAKSSLIRLSGELTADKENGLIKLYLITKALNYRRDNREVFEKGDYVPLYAEGDKADNLCAFARRLEERITIVAAPRFFTKLIQKPEELPFGKSIWKDSLVPLPFEKEGSRYRNIFTDEILHPVSRDGKTVLYLSDTFANFPVALLEKQTG